MTEPTTNAATRKRLPWGGKRGWTSHTAKFSPEESAALKAMVEALNTTVDDVIHEAVALHLVRNLYLNRAA